MVATIGSGYIFGAVLGTVYTLIGTTSGAFGAFIIIRYFFYDYISLRLKGRLKKLQTYGKSRGVYYIISLHFLPATPFPLINIVAALSDIKASYFIGATLVGITPGVIVYTLFGQQLTHVSKLNDLWSTPVIILFVSMSLVAFIPILIEYMYIYNKRPKP
jgi:uncharacterized membrane protein YdjX (TVP38/TMEM64 family)